jgi:hypothetical protein
MQILVETKTRDTCFGSDVQKLRQDKWPVTHLATYVNRGDTRADTVSRVKAKAECVMTYLSESVGEGGEMYYPFEEAFHGQVSPGLLKVVETDVSQNFVTLASSLEQPRVLMSFAWTISFVMQCSIVLVWIRNCFLVRRNSGPKRHWHMDGRNIKIRSNPAPSN